MPIRYSLAVLAATLLVQPVFADEMNSMDKPCAPIVKSCLDAGYVNEGVEGKQFWKDCMRPLLLNQTVSGITVDAKDVKACRAGKIKQLKQELSDLKKAS